MLDLMITYELAKQIHADRLKKAEVARLIDSLKAAPEPTQAKKWLWRFRIKDSFTTLFSKTGRPRRLRSSSNG